MEFGKNSMYRPEIKVFDVTIRDGGLMNDWHFSKEMVAQVFQALSAAGVDYMEIGYRASKQQFPPEKHGVWKFCDDDVVREVAEEGDMKLSIMVDVGRVDDEQIRPRAETIISTIRVATYVKDIDKAIHLANLCREQGYETFVNIMAVSHALEPDLDEALYQLRDSIVDGVYLVDSFGYLYSEQVQYLAKKYLAILAGKKVGIHCHNNQQLAFANTIEGIICGINYLDASLFGIGRAAGNCPLELLMGFLKNPKFDLRPILEIISTTFLPLQAELEWGYQIPYALTGILNKHPRSAMALMNSENRNNFREFYEGLLDEEELA